MDAASVLDTLTTTARPLAELDAPPDSGVYAYLLAPGSALPGIGNTGSAALYIGVSANLAQREFDTHFAEGKTGYSTLRRSIGAMLKDQLDLDARPRGSGASETNFTHYRFDDDGEWRLSAWMREALRVAVKAAPEPDALERELIALACPPLNLKGWPNPKAETIRALRKACVNEARHNRPRR